MERNIRLPVIFSLCQRFEGYFFLDIYQAVETRGQGELFNFHEKPNPNCPVGKNIHRVLDESLLEVQKKFEERIMEIILCGKALC